MTAKQYLLEVHKLRRRIESLELREQELRTKAEGLRAIVYDKDRVQTSPENHMEEIMAALVETQEEYGKTIAECYAAIAIREHQIAALPPRFAEVLRLRYIEHHKGRQLTMSEIAKRMGYSFDRARHLHGDALKEFEKKYKVDTL